MTAANLAVIFGPNLLQKERGVGGGGEVTPHSAAGMEDSAAIINVTLMLIQNYRKLFMVRQASTSCPAANVELTCSL